MLCLSWKRAGEVGKSEHHVSGGRAGRGRAIEMKLTAKSTSRLKRRTQGSGLWT